MKILGISLIGLFLLSVLSCSLFFSLSYSYRHWYIAMFVAAPNCPVGYSGPGGISDDGKYKGCTGGIYRYIDEKVLGEEHMEQGAGVVSFYGG